MTRLDDAIERLRALPEGEQEMMAAEIESLLSEPASLISSAQWMEVEKELDSDDGVHLTHAEVMSRMRARFGR